METTNLVAVTASFLIAKSSDLLKMSWKYNLCTSKDKTAKLKTAKQSVGRCILTLFALLSDRPDKSSNRLLVCLGVTAADDGAAECIGAPAVGLLGPEGGEGKLADAKSANSPCCLKIIKGAYSWQFQFLCHFRHYSSQRITFSRFQMLKAGLSLNVKVIHRLT